MEIWFFLHFNIIQDSFENRSRGWYARKSLSVWKSYEKAKGNPWPQQTPLKIRLAWIKLDSVGPWFARVQAWRALGLPSPELP